jgi:acyl-CoA dehydrogenase
MSSSELTEELKMFRESIQQFLKEEVAPYYRDWEKASIIPRSAWEKLGEAGFLCVDMPEEYGGSGVPYAFSGLVHEEIAYAGFGGLASNTSVHSDIIAPYILHNGTEEQKNRWIPKMVSGQAVGAIAMTEPGAGSDLQGIRTTAKKNGSDFILNGSKTFISNGQHADVVIVVAKTDSNAGAKGITLFLVDATLPGFKRGRNLDKLGMHCSDTSELFFEDVRLPQSAILGKEGEGFFILMNELPRERLSIAMCGLGSARGAFDITVDYVLERTAFGSPIAKFQNTRFKLAELKTQIEVNSAYLHQCMEKLENGELNATQGSLAKLSSTEMQWKVVDDCLQLFGGYGYMEEYPISRFLADARVQRIYGGTSEIMKEVISRSFLGK